MDAVYFLARNNYNGLIADMAGLGKTYVALTAS